jgi:tetratricopeptide (TPR) repeat protein
VGRSKKFPKWPSHQWWLITLTVLLVIETGILIWLEYASSRKKTEMRTVVNTLHQHFRKVPLYAGEIDTAGVDLAELKRLVAVAQKDGFEIPEFLIRAGNLEFAAGRQQQALTYYRQARDKTDQALDAELYAICAENMSSVFIASHQPDSAVLYRNEARAIYAGMPKRPAWFIDFETAFGNAWKRGDSSMIIRPGSTATVLNLNNPPVPPDDRRQ